MDVPFDTIAYAAENSLTLIVDDIARQRRADPMLAAVEQDLESWLNALQRQALPLVSSPQGQANLEAWLNAVELDSADA